MTDIEKKLFGIKEEKNNSEKVKTGFWIEKYLMDEVDEFVKQDCALSRSHFMKKALDFYCGYLKSDRDEIYLSTAINRVLSDTIDKSEQRIARVLYKLAVEVAMQNRIEGYANGFTEVDLEEIREDAEEEVKEIIGYWDRY